MIKSREKDNLFIINNYEILKELLKIKNSNNSIDNDEYVRLMKELYTSFCLNQKTIYNNNNLDRS